MTQPTPEPTPPPGSWGAAPSPPTAPSPYVAPDPQAKSRLTAGLLGIFLGSLGVHRFYLGYTSVGVLQILVTIATLGIGAVWGFVEGIVILSGSGLQTDADGRPLRP